MRRRWELSDAQWELIKPLLRPQRRTDGRGGPWQDTRAVLNGILWVLGTGAQRRELADKYPPYRPCHRRFQQWVREGKLEGLLHALSKEFAPVENWNWRKHSSTPPSPGLKRGPRGGAHQARQRDENHRSRR